jgi:hypothetical protein
MESVEMGLCFTLARSRGEEWSGWCVPDMIFLTAHHEDIAAAGGRTQVLKLRLHIIFVVLSVGKACKTSPFDNMHFGFTIKWIFLAMGEAVSNEAQGTRNRNMLGKAGA